MLFELVAYMLRHKFSPQQIAGKLRTMNILGYERTYVCRETIYSAIYALPVGDLIKGKANGSTVGTLVERTCYNLVRKKMLGSIK